MNRQPPTSIAYLNTPAAKTTQTCHSTDAMDRSKTTAVPGQAQQTRGPLGLMPGSNSSPMPPTRLANSDFDRQQALTLKTGSKRSSASSALPELTTKPGGEPLRRTRRALHKTRKAVRACNHCQRSHLTCNDSRPCERCVKRGLAESCVDGTRKKAKYLLDAEERASRLRAANEATRTAIAAAGPQTSLPEQHRQQYRPHHNLQQHQQLQALAHMSALSPPISSPTFATGGTLAAAAVAVPVSSVDLNMAAAPLGVPGLHAPPAAVNFGSEAINLEYAILSSMLSYPMFSNTPLGSAIDGTNGGGNQSAVMSANSTISMPNTLWAAQQQQQQQQQHPTSLSSLLLPPSHSQLSAAMSDSTSQIVHADQGVFDTTGVAASGSGSAMAQRQEHWPPRSMAQQQMQLIHGHQQTTAPVQPSPPPHAQIVSDDTHYPLSRPSTTGPAVYGLNPVYPQSPAEVYSSVTEPYKYYNGFHFFFRHISGRMDKKDIMRVSRAIAHFRPSLVAQLRNLTHDDLVFMEKSFQRALMEYEKLIGFIGTPTVVWRRSGEIALVGKEFSILTKWDRQQLISGNRFIFELMDTKSAVTYWEQFAVHAFENSEHSVMAECCLVRPDGVTVPCAFSFTIKRDLFGIPMAIIGNFLPIL
ncbi:Transcriptional regulator of nonfermentable carbon utilization [Coemansia sp. BCRC 34301]|nr:Transcriptional regulator of nonfermentable carbon utilization [Coemansia sp. BCRC 34301]